MFELTYMLAGLDRALSDFVREISVSTSCGDGLPPSSDGRDEFGAWLTVSVEVCDLDLCISCRAGRCEGGKLGCSEDAAADAASEGLGCDPDRL